MLNENEELEFQKSHLCENRLLSDLKERIKYTRLFGKIMETINENKIKNPVFAKLHNDTSFHGTILIPDISGFTKFVSETEFDIGRDITSSLLKVIIDSNTLNLKISEIEGDAVLFYKKDHITPAQIKYQFEIMLNNFNYKINELKAETGIEIGLSLKLIAHYGEISTYEIGNFEKLYGKSVIEAHSLLKNSIDSNSYLLITDNLLNKSKKDMDSSFYYGSQLCEVHGNLKRICFSYFDYEKDLLNIKATSNVMAHHATLWA